ncbi:hypothetical protein BD309DRAFT_720511 [Dichomitus squalens]|nr:hypothetical protein BD309DRAFT_720511 [Dichomitus squalens]
MYVIRGSGSVDAHRPVGLRLETDTAVSSSKSRPPPSMLVPRGSCCTSYPPPVTSSFQPVSSAPLLCLSAVLRYPLEGSFFSRSPSPLL